jgi:aspartyl-tRNA(Asn)/glutamyl-tRNA(Gln) amidotransferase subunit A
MNAARDDDLTRMTIATAAKRIRDGDVSPSALVTAVLERIAATEPVVHAFVSVQAEAALAAAQRAENALQLGRDPGPLCGIPVAVKDIIDIEGLPTRCGSELRADALPAATDAPVVTRLRAAGAIVIGKTVTHEFAAGVVSPPARNPWDAARNPGGSSGGSGASVAAGSSFAALGTNTAGSIRIPAALTGVAGLKPTYGRVSRHGVFPLSWSLDTVGPLTRTAEDAHLVFQAMHDDDGTAADDGSSTRDDLSGIRLGVPRPYFYDRLQSEVADAVERALGTLSGLNAEIVEVAWAEAGAAAAAGFVMCRPEMAAVHERSLRTTPERFGPVLCSRLEAFSLFPGEGYLRARRARTVLRASIANLFDRHRLTAMITPTAPATATAADAFAIQYADADEPIHSGFTRLTMPFNTTGQPALSLPCGFDHDGLPIGLQIVGRPDDEAGVCQIGRMYEEATGSERRWPPL